MTTLIQIGPVQFRLVGLNTQEIKHSRKIPYADHKVVGAEPIKEFMGPDNAELEISGTVFPYAESGRGSLQGIAALEVARDSAMPMPVVRGDGYVFGWYVIEEVKQEHGTLSAQGIGREVKYTVKLCSVGSPGIGGIGAIFTLFGL